MASGIAAGPWGYSPRYVAGINKAWEIGKHPLVYEEALTSYSPRFNSKNYMRSPLNYANKNYYNRINSRFGAKSCKKDKQELKKFKAAKAAKKVKAAKACRPLSRNRCIEFLQSNRKINPLSGRSIQRDGPTYRTLINKCIKYNLVSGKVSGKVSVSAGPLKNSRSIGVGNNRTYSEIGVGNNRTYSDAGVGNNRTYSEIGVGRSSPIMVSGGTDPIFIGSLPEPPDEREPIRRSPRTNSGALKRTSSKSSGSGSSSTSSGSFAREPASLIFCSSSA